MNVRLPEGWTSHEDGAGRAYLYNQQTGETRWLWSRHAEPVSRREFMYNNVTGERIWIDDKTKAAVATGAAAFASPSAHTQPSAMPQQQRVGYGASHAQRVENSFSSAGPTAKSGALENGLEHKMAGVSLNAHSPGYLSSSGGVTPHAGLAGIPNNMQFGMISNPYAVQDKAMAMNGAAAPHKAGAHAVQSHAIAPGIAQPDANTVNTAANTFAGAQGVNVADSVAASTSGAQAAPIKPAGASANERRKLVATTAVPPNGQRLFMNEVECVSSSGRPYAYNKETGKSRWLPREHRKLRSRDEAILYLQSSWRAYTLRKRKLLDTIAALRAAIKPVLGLTEPGCKWDLEEMESVVRRVSANGSVSNGANSELAAVAKDAVALGELVTQTLIRLDGTSTFGDPILRQHRKSAIRQMNAVGERADGVRRSAELNLS